MWSVQFKKSVLGFGKLITLLYEFHDIHISSFSSLRPDTVFNASNAVRMRLHPPQPFHSPSPHPSPQPQTPIHSPHHSPLHSPIHIPSPHASPSHSPHISPHPSPLLPDSPLHLDPTLYFDDFLPSVEVIPPSREHILPDNDFQLSSLPLISPRPPSSQPSASSTSSHPSQVMLTTIIDRLTTQVMSRVSSHLTNQLCPMIVQNVVHQIRLQSVVPRPLYCSRSTQTSHRRHVHTPSDPRPSDSGPSSSFQPSSARTLPIRPSTAPSLALQPSWYRPPSPPPP